jgi:hypothetical protein
MDDGTLQHWDDIAGGYRRGAVLLGNGLSINVSKVFDYPSLWEKGCEVGALTVEDRQLFAAAAPFERVLADVGTAARVADACGQTAAAAAFRERYESIRRALGVTIREAHVAWRDFGEETRSAIRTALCGYGCVFTTNYDLLTYWAMGSGATGFEGFFDGFWADDYAFDTDWNGYARGTAVHFLHGALHLVEHGRTARKLVRVQEGALLEQFGLEERRARPLLVTEGRSREKLEVIEHNDYLRFGLSRLREHPGALVVFGHSLSAEDAHLLEAINAHPERRVAVSVHGAGDERAVRKRKGEIRAALSTTGLDFFDAQTHPLGAGRLRSDRRPRAAERRSRASTPC